MKPGSACVLILSKDPQTRSILEFSAIEFGFKVKVIDHVEELVAVSLDLPVIAWFVDLDGLPKKPKGIVSLGRKKAPDARLVFISTEFEEEIANSCIEEGATALLVKPVIVSRLVKIFNQIMFEPELATHGEWEENTRTANENNSEKSISKKDEGLLRKVDFKCPVCSTAFLGTRFKLWILPVTDTDSDFCPNSCDKVHPELYSVMICPTCFFGTYVGDFNRMEFQESPKKKFLGMDYYLIRKQMTFNLDLKEERTLLHGIKSFELAATSALQLEYRNYLRLAAEFYLKASWLCRRMGHEPQEHDAQYKSCELFKRVYRPYSLINGRFPASGTIFATLDKGMDKLPERAVVVSCFLIADLARRLKDYTTAEKYFDEVKKIPFFHKFTSLSQHIYTVDRLFREELKKHKDTPEKGKKSGKFQLHGFVK
ncbi:MAG: DUF2225 domain-containing protein [Candidatus Riflebacteria bacterium]|nr:DUF2225 domain-containing protein [Candidatus Riflebacteria bacterium]